MKQSKWVIGMVIGIAMLQAGSVLADESKPVVSATNKDDFAAVAAAIQQQMQAGGHWQYMQNSQRQAVRDKLADMQTIFAKTPDVAQMDPADKMQLLADQENINAILTKNDDRRVICDSEIPVGSHLPVKTCRTLGQIERDRENARDSLDQATVQLRAGH